MTVLEIAFFLSNSALRSGVTIFDPGLLPSLVTRWMALVTNDRAIGDMLLDVLGTVDIVY